MDVKDSEGKKEKIILKLSVSSKGNVIRATKSLRCNKAMGITG